MINVSDGDAVEAMCIHIVVLHEGELMDKWNDLRDVLHLPNEYTALSPANHVST